METNNYQFIFYLFYICGWIILAFKFDIETIVGLILVVGGGFVWSFLWMLEKGYIKCSKVGKNGSN